MNRQRFTGTALALLFVSLGPATARADRLVGFGQLSVSYGRFTSELAQEFERTPLSWNLGAGIRYLDLSLVAFAEFGPVAGQDEARHGYSPLHVALGGDARYYFAQTSGWQPYARLGLARQTVSDSGKVTRWCAESRTCTGGFWSEEPRYSGWSTRVGLGLQYTAENRFGMYHAYWFDVGYDAFHDMEIVEQTPRGGLLTITLGAAFGGGRTR